jgi:hypothetical protein
MLIVLVSFLPIWTECVPQRIVSDAGSSWIAPCSNCSKTMAWTGGSCARLTSTLETACAVDVARCTQVWMVNRPVQTM